METEKRVKALEKGSARVLVHETREPTGALVHEHVTIRFEEGRGFEGLMVSMSYEQADDLLDQLHDVMIYQRCRIREEYDAQTCEIETRTPTGTGKNAKSAWS